MYRSEELIDLLQRQLSQLAERQQYIDKLLSEKGTAIGKLPNPDDEQFEQTLAESRSTADRTRRKLEQHHRLVLWDMPEEEFVDACNTMYGWHNSALPGISFCMFYSRRGVTQIAGSANRAVWSSLM